MNILRKRSYLALLPVVGLTMALSAQAADTTAGKTMGMPEAKAPMHQPATIATMHDARVSKLIGTDVVNAKGEDLGEIEDLVIDTTNGKIDYAVLSFGGFLGMGDKLFAYPLTQFKPSAKDRGTLALNVYKDKLKGSPGFEAKTWPDFNKGEYRVQVDRYHGYKSGSAQHRYVRASDVLKGDVKDAQRKDIGDIEDVVVDLSSGKVQFVVVEFDRAWNPFDKLVAVPMRALTSEDRDGTDLVYSASRDELKTAPSFKKSDWPDLSADMRFRSDMNRYDKQWKGTPQITSAAIPRS